MINIALVLTTCMVLNSKWTVDKWVVFKISTGNSWKWWNARNSSCHDNSKNYNIRTHLRSSLGAWPALAGVNVDKARHSGTQRRENRSVWTDRMHRIHAANEFYVEVHRTLKLPTSISRRFDRHRMSVDWWLVSPHLCPHHRNINRARWISHSVLWAANMLLI